MGTTARANLISGGCVACTYKKLASAEIGRSLSLSFTMSLTQVGIAAFPESLIFER
jgi:hypothetical protein